LQLQNMVSEQLRGDIHVLHLGGDAQCRQVRYSACFTFGSINRLPTLCKDGEIQAGKSVCKG
jgi:hypothetical protein